MTLDDVVRTVTLWRSMGLKNIRFSGGEPTQAMPSLEAGIAAAIGCDHIAISTNGSAPWATYERLLSLGVNDFSVSLDACCAADGDRISGVEGSWHRVVTNIKKLSDTGVYVTVGIVVLPDTEQSLHETIALAELLGVSDIRPIPAAQWSNAVSIPDIDYFPILHYRANRSRFRGCPHDKCYLVLDDMAVMGDKHYPCIIYLREGGEHIGTVGPEMREERHAWHLKHSPKRDKICSAQCLDVCVDYNKRYDELHRPDQDQTKA